MSKPWPKPGMREANKLTLWVDGIPKPQGSKSIGPNGHMYEANKGPTGSGAQADDRREPDRIEGEDHA